MSDFQFVCPFCEQVLDCPVEYDGLETECPVCKNQIVPIANNDKNDIFQKTSVGNKPIVNPNTDNVVVQTIQPPNKFKIENEFLAAKKSINFLIKWIIIALKLEQISLVN